MLRTWGESESGLNDRLDHVIEQLERPDTPTLAFLASGWEGLKVRLTAKAATVADCARQLDEWEAGDPRASSVTLVFGVDDDTMESVVLDACRRRGLTLATAESVTGGLVGGPADRHRRCQRRVPRLDRQLRDRRQAVAAGGRRRPGGQRSRSTSDGARRS